MKNSNPVFRTVVKNTEAQDMFYEKKATYKGIFIKTSIVLASAVISGLIAILLLGTAHENFVYGLLGVSGVITLVSVIIASFSVRMAPVFTIIYGVFEGITLGVITFIVNKMFPGIALATIGATVGIFIIMLALYSSRTIRVTSTFRKVMYAGLIGILLYSLVIGMIQLFNQGMIQNIWVTIFVGLGLLIYGAFMLVLDFNHATLIVEHGLDKKYEWQVVLGLSVTIVWIYIQALSLLIRVFGRSNN